MARKMAIPCRLSRTFLPKVKHRAAGISRRETISKRLDRGVGFSKGCAELFPKKPPPLVPSCLIAIWLAAGPRGITCFVTTVSVPSSCSTVTGSNSSVSSYRLKVWGVPWEAITRETITERGISTYSTVLVISA